MHVLLLLARATLGSIVSTAAAGALLVLGYGKLERLIPSLVSFAAGTLLAGATLGLLPKALDRAAPMEVTGALLGGLIGFFLLEHVVIWRHCHDPQCDIHQASGYLILVGDAVHNFMDGVAIGAAFAVGIPLGITTGLAVAAHEVPQEVGDFGILLSSGFPIKQALGLNIVSASCTVPGAVVAFFAFSAIEGVLGMVLALAASSFLYIALADLFPRLHGKRYRWALLRQLSLIALGIATILAVRLLTA
jgi:zinc and cadmium transporter